MKKCLLFAVLAVFLVTMPAAASVQNVKVSGNIDSTGLMRNGFNLQKIDQFKQTVLFTQTSLRVDADLTDNVSTTVGLLNERSWGEHNARVVSSENYGDNDLLIGLAYVTLREMLYSPLTVTVGRQHFAFGNSFVIDSYGSNNSTSTGGLKGVAEDMSIMTNLDAVKLTFDYNPLTIDVVGAKVAHRNNLGVNPGSSAHQDDQDLLGVNANWQIGDSLGTVLEGYFWSKVDEQVTNPNAKKETVYMPGVRAAANLLDGWNLSAEAAIQKGSSFSGLKMVDRNAFATQLISVYKLPLEDTKKYSPVLVTGYSYFSGTHQDDLTDKWSEWDPMFENQNGGKIFNTLFNQANCHHLMATASIKPLEDLTASLSFDALWLAKRLPETAPGNGVTSVPLVQPDGSSTTAQGTTNRYLGNEFGMGLSYDYTEDVKFGANYNWFVPGDVFSKDGIDGGYKHIASQAMVSAKVAF